MDIPSLDVVLLNLSEVFPYFIEFILCLMAIGGLFCVATGVYIGWEQAMNGGKGQSYGSQPTPWKSIGLFILGGLLGVPLVVMWDTAGTFLDGGSETYNILSYLDPSDSSAYCVRVRAAVILFWMCMGVVAIATGLWKARDRILHGPHAASWWTVSVLVISGVLCFFVTDVAVVVANTIGIESTFDSVCEILGGTVE